MCISYFISINPVPLMCVWFYVVICRLFSKYKHVGAVNYFVWVVQISHVWCVLLYRHTPLRFNSFRILLHSVGECGNPSMSIMICLVCSKFVTGHVQCCFQVKLVCTVWVVCVFVCVWMSLGFKAGIDCLPTEFCLVEDSLWVRLLVELPVVVLSSIWLTHCATSFIVLSIISPWSVSYVWAWLWQNRANLCWSTLIDRWWKTNTINFWILNYTMHTYWVWGWLSNGGHV